MSDLHLVEPTKADWTKTATLVGIYAGTVGLATCLLVPQWWHVWVVMAIGGLFALVFWHTKTFGYRCTRCGHEFTLSFLQNLLSPQGFKNGKGWKYTSCPSCSDRAGAVVLKRVEVT